MRNLCLRKFPGSVVALRPRTAIMGILNVTPDSFSDGGQYFDRDKAVARGQEIEQEGADIIDIGGESSRPGSEEGPEDEEMRRVVPGSEDLRRAAPIPHSGDKHPATVRPPGAEA